MNVDKYFFLESQYQDAEKQAKAHYIESLQSLKEETEKQINELTANDPAEDPGVWLKSKMETVKGRKEIWLQSKRATKAFVADMKFVMDEPQA